MLLECFFMMLISIMQCLKWPSSVNSDQLASKGAILYGPEVIQLFSRSTQLSIKFQLLIKLQLFLKIQKKILLSNFHILYYHANNSVKMPTIVGILTFMSMIHFILS